MWGWCTGSGGWLPWGGVGGLLLVGLVVAAIVWGLGGGGRRSGDRDHKQGARADRDDARRLLNRRLAAGEIDLEEYERLRRAIES